MGVKGESVPIDPTKDFGRRTGILAGLRDRWVEEDQSPKHALHELNQKAYLKALPGLKVLLPESVTDVWEENMIPSEIVAALDKAIGDAQKEDGGGGQGVGRKK